MAYKIFYTCTCIEYEMCGVMCFALQRMGDPEAQLTQQEIQAGIDQANEETLEALECEQ